MDVRKRSSDKRKLTELVCDSEAHGTQVVTIPVHKLRIDVKVTFCGIELAAPLAFSPFWESVDCHSCTEHKGEP